MYISHPHVSLSDERKNSMFNQFRRQMVTAGDRDQEEFLDNLVSQLLEEAQSNAKGPSPASKRFIQLLPTVRRDGLEK